MTVEEARKVLLRQPATEGEHHGHPDYRVKNKIFATLWPKQHRAVLRLPMELAEAQAKEYEDRCKIVSRSGGMGWLSVGLDLWKRAEFLALADVARNLRSS